MFVQRIIAYFVLWNANFQTPRHNAVPISFKVLSGLVLMYFPNPSGSDFFGLQILCSVAASLPSLSLFSHRYIVFQCSLSTFAASVFLLPSFLYATLFLLNPRMAKFEETKKEKILGGKHENSIPKVDKAICENRRSEQEKKYCDGK
jgi:hypothetical protein